MIAVALLVVAASIWLLWEWRSGALVPAAERDGKRPRAITARAFRSLPTSAALNADAAVVARLAPRT